MILVAGGTGTLGRELLARLAATGEQVRVLTRDAAHAQGLGAQVSIGDVCEPRTLAAAVDGCAIVVSAVHGFLGGRGRGPEAVDNRGVANLVRAATDAGVGHFILLSVLDARPDHPMSLHRAKHAGEQHLYAGGLAYTVLRPSAYLETWSGIIGAKLADGGPALVFGHGSNPINFVSVRDVAALVEHAIHDPRLHGRTIDVPGPVNLTMVQLAQLLGATKIRHIPRGALHVLGTVAAPFAPAFSRQAGAALVMDTGDMTADAAALHTRFPQITWQRAEP
ncbi:MAG TPA: SDR family oxidoreductase [Jatrophihabitans sp.]|nr:SDR family oxidoreductase [Jatrophihabitans sp.]